MPTPAGIWRPTEIRYFIESWDTGTEVALVATDAGNGYIKALGNRGGEHCLACEWVGTNLARWFGLPTFDFTLIEVTDVDEIPFKSGAAAQPGPAFITRAESGEPWSGKAVQLGKVVNPRDVSRLIVFDTWVLNCDRYAPNKRRKPNYNNVFLSAEAPEGRLVLKAMDHTHVFTCGRDITPRVADIDHVKDEDCYGCFPEFRKLIQLEAFREALDDLASLDRLVVEEVVRSIPAEWGVSEKARQALVKLIEERARYLSSNRTGIMGMHLLQQGLDLPESGEGS
ncbi:HipA family kinase [Paludisphaera rhizosphaerae]|uniref:HipA family kinase n=1 Tax=Paludisphaera rhizosphaerae TaxID=2711216 RepID=UPI0013EA9BEA|nr:HipA family kinase [Paludisphaera rhizosphaerae]